MGFIIEKENNNFGAVSMNFILDAGGTSVLFLDILTGATLEVQSANTIQAIANNAAIRIQLTGGEKILIEALELATININGVQVTQVQATAINELNSLFANIVLSGAAPIITSGTTINSVVGANINYVVTSDPASPFVAINWDFSALPAGHDITVINSGNHTTLIGSTDIAIFPAGSYNLSFTAVNYYGSTVVNLTLIKGAAFTNTYSFYGGTTAANKMFLTDTALGYQVTSPLFRASNSTGLASDSTKAWSVVLWQKSANTTGWNALFGAGGTRQNRTWAGFDVYSEGDATYTTIRINYGHKWEYIYTDFELLGTSILDWKQICITYSGGDTLFSTNPTGQPGAEACFQVYVNGANVPQTTSYSVNGFDGAINANGFSGFHINYNPRIARTQYVPTVFTSKELYIDEVGFYDYALTPANVVDIWDGGTPQSLDGITGVTNPVDYFRCGDGANGANTDLLNFPVMYNFYPGSFNMEAQNMTVADYVSSVP